MSDKIRVKFSHPHTVGAGDDAKTYEVGDTAELERSEAKNLVRAGAATYADKTSAIAAEGETGAAKTAAAVKSKG